jgi:molybdopterin converting factor small subunit
VKFVGQVKEIVGETKRVVNLKEGTVQELLKNIYRLYPEQKKKLEQAGVFIGGVIVKHSEVQSIILKEGDELSLILPVAGG